VASKQLVKSIVIDAQKIKEKAFLLEKNAKKGLLTKLLQANSKRTSALIEILSETETQKTIKKKNEAILKKASVANSEQATKSNEEFLKKYYQTPKGGPNHSIAQNRAHHLTKFLRQYLLTGLLSGKFFFPFDHLFHFVPLLAHRLQIPSKSRNNIFSDFQSFCICKAFLMNVRNHKQVVFFKFPNLHILMLFN